MDMLISEVRKRELLWNRKNRDHRDRALVDKEWEDVGEKVGVPSK